MTLPALAAFDLSFFRSQNIVPERAANSTRSSMSDMEREVRLDWGQDVRPSEALDAAGVLETVQSAAKLRVVLTSPDCSPVFGDLDHFDCSH